MLINWFTVAAQIINFLILIWLLKHFLYDRILKVMDERREKISSSLSDAFKQKEEATREKEALREKKRELEEKTKNLLVKAEKEADTRRSELVKQSRDEIGALKNRWKDALEREKESFIQDLRRMAGKQIFSIARRALEDLAGADLEERIIEVFLDKFRKMDKNEIIRFSESINKAGNHVIIESAFDISLEMQEKIARVLSERIEFNREVRYQMNPDLVLGMELKTTGRKIAWSITDYLEALEEKASEALEKKGNEKRQGAVNG